MHKISAKLGFLKLSLNVNGYTATALTTFILSKILQPNYFHSVFMFSKNDTTH